MRPALLALIAMSACESPPPPAPPVATVSEPSPLPRSAFAGAEASSFLTDDSGSYDAIKVLDGDKGTAWCEGAEGLGLGETLTVRLARPTEVASLRIDGGHFKDDRTLTNNGRPRKGTLATDSGLSHEVIFPFVPQREFKAKEVLVKPVTVPIGATISSFTLTLVEADKGRFTEDVCISEIVALAP